MNIRIKEIRQEKGLSQSEVSKLLKISQQVYSNYELEQRKLPINILVKLSDLFNVSTDYILGLTDNPKRNK